jgi:hypothetical protein
MNDIRALRSHAPRPAGPSNFLPRLTLFIGMLMSGGMLLFPRPVLLGLLATLCLWQGAPTKVLRPEFSRIWLVILAILIGAMIGGGAIASSENITRFANIIGGVLLLSLYIDQPRDKLAYDLVPILKWMAIQAILTPPLALLLPNFFVPIEVNDTTYQSLLLIFNYHVTLDLPGSIPRPDGFFWEPGVFQIYLNLLLYISLFVFKRPRLVALAIAGVVATQSTTGVIVCAVQLGYFALRKLQTAGLRERILVLVLAPVALVPVFLFAYANLNSKLTGDYRGSAWARQYDLITGIRIANEYPLTGIGFDYERYYIEAQRLGYNETQLGIGNITERSNSNSFASLFAYIGYPLGLVIVFGMLRQRFLRDKMLIAVMLTLSLISEALLLTPLFLAIVFSGLLVAPKVPADARRTALNRAAA